MWVAEGVTENQQRVEQAPLLPIGPLPYIQCHNTATWVALPWRIPKAPPLTCNRLGETKKKKEQIKVPEKMQLRDEEIANLSEAQFKILVIRMLTELVEYGCKIEEKVEVYTK